MAKFKIEIKKSAVREIKKLLPVHLKKIIIKIGELADNPRPKGCVKLTRSEEHTSELQSHSFISYAVFCLKKKRSNYNIY